MLGWALQFLDPSDTTDTMKMLRAMTAWVSVYCPEAGWLDVDPTNNVVPSQSHVTLAWGQDYDDVSPVRGVILGGQDHKLEVAVDLEPLTIL